MKKLEKVLALWEKLVYIISRCDMIAMKREVAAYAGFPWSECQKAGNPASTNWRQVTVQNSSPQLCGKTCEHFFYNQRIGNTRQSVQSPLVVLS